METFRKKIFSVFVFLLILNGLNATDVCKKGCSASDNGKLRYQPGTVYTYSFDSAIHLILTDNEKDETGLKIQGEANVYAEGNCLYTLKLEKLDIQSNRDKIQKHFTQDLDKPIQFTLTNGELDSQICTNPKDSDFSLNIKRGIASMLQSSDKQYEIDIFGGCPTSTTRTTTSDNYEIVTKSRNLNACGYRETISTGLITTIQNQESDIKSMLNGDYIKEQKIKNGIIENVILNEEYQFSPATKQSGGGTHGKVRTHMNLIKQTAGKSTANPSELNKSRTVIFENPKPITNNNVNVVKSVLIKTIKSLEHSTSEKSAELFIDIIRLMTTTKTDKLLELHQQVKSGTIHPDKQLARNVFFDSLFRVGTGNSVETIAKIIPEMTENEKKLAFLSLNLARTVTKEALQAINALLDANTPNEGYLSIGNLIDTYCKQENCEIGDIKQITDKFLTKLNNCNAKTRSDENSIINVLKGIRNVQKIANSGIEKLLQCTNEKRSQRLRVAALQSLQLASCNPKVQQQLLQILKNYNEDSEIRIEAYLILMECPTAKLATEIATIINKEEIYQVGTYIVSHLKKIRDSTEPKYDQAKYHFSNIRIIKKFPIDIRRYSQNNEYSYRYDQYGVGGSIDYNVIYSQSGFLPRSVNLNLTTVIFGNSVNLFEMNIRQENIEQLLENYFGPKGYLNDFEQQELIDKLIELNEKTTMKRTKRDLPGDVKTFGKKLKQTNDDINFDYSIKMFGNEYFFLSLNDNSEFLEKLNHNDINDLFQESFDTITEKLKNFNYERKTHSIFLNNELIYPTSLGFPLELQLQGVNIGRLELSGNIDLREIISDMKNIKIELNLAPSYNLNINGLLKINGYYFNTGIRSKTLLHSSIGSKIIYQTRNGNEFDLNIDFPQKKQELITVDYNIEYILEDLENELKTIDYLQKSKTNQLQNTCFDQFSLVGVQVCYSMVEPFKFSLWFEVEKKIHLNGIYNGENLYNNKFTLKYDTPSQPGKHDTTLEIETGLKPKLFAKIKLDNPSKHLYGEIGLRNDDKEFGFYGIYENGIKLTAKLGYRIYNGNELEPLIEFNSNGHITNELFGYRINGRIIISKNELTKYQFNNLQIVYVPENKPIILNGFTEIGPLMIVTDLKLNYESEDLTLKGTGTLNNGFDIKLELLNPRRNFKGDFAYGLEFKNDMFRHEIVIGYQQFRFELHNLIKVNPETYDLIKTENKFILQPNNIEIKLNYEERPKYINYDVLFNFQRGRLGSKLELRYDEKQPGDYVFDFDGTLNVYTINVKGKNLLDQNQKATMDYSFQTSWGSIGSLKGFATKEISLNEGNVNLNGQLKLSKTHEPYSFTIIYKGAAKKTQFDVKILNGKIEEFILLNELERNNNIVTGKINLKISDVAQITGELKSDPSSQNDITLLIDLKKLNKKLKFDATLTYLLPKVYFKTDLFYDYEKDNNKHIIYELDNIFDSNHVQLNNLIDIDQQKYIINFNAIEDDQQNTNAKFLLKLPTHHEYSLDLVSTVKSVGDQERAGKININGYYKNDKQQQATIKLQYDVNRLNTNVNERYYDVIQTFTFTNFNGETVQLDGHKTHLPKSGTHFDEAKLNIKLYGTLISSPIDFTLNLDEFCDQHVVYSTNGNLLNTIQWNLNGNIYRGNNEKREPLKHELQLNLNTIYDTLKDYKLKINGIVLDLGDYDNDIGEYKYILQQELNHEKTDVAVNLKGSRQHGTYSINVILPRHDPLRIDGDYDRNIDKTEEHRKLKTKLNFEYGQKQLRSQFDLNLIKDKSINLHYKLQAHHEQLKNFEIIFKSEQTNDDTVNTNSQIIYNDKTYGLNTVLVLSKVKSLVDIIFITPDSKEIKLNGLIENLGERKGKISINIENFGDFYFNGKSEANFESYETFYIITDVNTPKLDEFHFEVKSKNDKNLKGVDFKVNTKTETLLTGTAQYKIKTDTNKVTLDGHGNINMNNKPLTCKFKLIRQKYTNDIDHEIGYSYKLESLFGPKKTDFELKSTTKTFRIIYHNSDDTDKMKKNKFELINEVKKTDQNNYERDLKVNIDFRQIGSPYKFDLESNTKIDQDAQLLEYDLEIDLQHINNNKYEFDIYYKPKKTGIKLELPKREIVFEILAKFDLTEPFTFNGERSATFYFDKKNKPNDKVQLTYSVDSRSLGEKHFYQKAELKFFHPQIRPLKIISSIDFDYSNINNVIIKYNSIYDIFKMDKQKIIADFIYELRRSENSINYNTTFDGKLKYSDINYIFYYNTGFAAENGELSYVIRFDGGQQNDCKFELSAFNTKDQAVLKVISFNEEIISANVKRSNNYKTIDMKGNIKIFNLQPIIISYDMENLQSSQLTIRRDGIYSFTINFNLDKKADFHFIGNQHELINGQIILTPENFLQTSYEVYDKDVQDFTKLLEETIKKDTEVIKGELRKRIEIIQTTIGQHLNRYKDSTPDFTPLYKNIADHSNALYDELNSDPFIKKVFTFFSSIFDVYSKVATTLYNAYNDFAFKTNEIRDRFYESFQKIYQEKIGPAIQSFVSNIIHLLSDLLGHFINFLGTLFGTIAKILKKFENDFNQFGKTVSGFVKNVLGHINKLLESFSTELDKFYDEAVKTLNDLPQPLMILRQVKDAILNWEGTKLIFSFIKDILPTIKELMPTEEAKLFIENFYTYLDAKLNGQDVNDWQEWKKLYISFITGVRSIIYRLTSEQTDDSILDSLLFTSDVKNYKPLNKLGELEISWINYLNNQKNLLQDYLYISRNPYDLLPPFDIYGTIADGKNVFTFDGRHLTVPGTCSYIFAQDLQNNNFSIIGNLQNGKLKSIILIDRQDYIEINDDGQIKLNGQKKEYPQHHNTLHSWRRYYTISILTEYGVEILCTENLRVCHIKINGFYTGKLRGLFGNGNSEPYDDYLLPNGKITDNYAEFINTYGLQKSCPPIQPEHHEQHQHHSNECSDLFNIDSPLLFGYLFINPKIYRQACEYAVEKSSGQQKQDTICNIALAYSSFGRFIDIPIDLPDQCIKCNQKLNLDDEFHINNQELPTKKADIIFVVDTQNVKILNDLITPLIHDLRQQLKSRDINDNHIIVIGYNPLQKYPKLFTTNGKFDFNGKFDKIELNGPINDDITNLGSTKLNKYLELFKLEQTNSLFSTDAKAFDLAMDYPFRSDATKTIVAVRSDNLEVSNLVKIFAATISNEIAQLNGISLHLIGPVRDLQLTGAAAKDSGNIVGFTPQTIVTLADHNKKSNLGSINRNNLKYTGDLGIDLVQDDGGYVFALQNFQQLKPEKQKRFALTVANSLADYISRIEFKANCVCKAAYGLHGEESCTVTDMKLQPAKKAATAARG